MVGVLDTNCDSASQRDCCCSSSGVGIVEGNELVDSGGVRRFGYEGSVGSDEAERSNPVEEPLSDDGICSGEYVFSHWCRVLSDDVNQLTSRNQMLVTMQANAEIPATTKHGSAYGYSLKNPILAKMLPVNRSKG